MWNSPWSELEQLFDGATWPRFGRLHRELDRALGSGVEDSGDFPSVKGYAVETAADGHKSIVLEFSLPGVLASDFEVEVLRNQLTLRGSRKVALPESRSVRRERFAGAFERQIILPFVADNARTEAHYRDGVLSIQVHMAASEKPKRIEVRNK